MTESTYEIAEADVSGALKDVYADIRHQLRLPMVNLVYRRLAALGELESLWESVQVLLGDSRLEGLAELLVVDIADSGQAIPADAVEIVAGSRDVEPVRNVLSAFARANSINLVLLTAVTQGLNTSDATPYSTSASYYTAVTSRPVTDDVWPVWKPLPGSNDLRQPVRALVEDMADKLICDRPPALMPTLLRQLAPWPEVLALLCVATNSRIAELDLHESKLRRRASAAVSTLPRMSTALSDNSLSVLGEFLGVIPRMLAFGTYCQQALNWVDR